MRSAPSTTSIHRTDHPIAWRKQDPTNAMNKRVLRLLHAMSAQAREAFIEIGEQLAEPSASVAVPQLRLVASRQRPTARR